MLKYFKTSLAVRTAAIILLMVAVVGVVFLVFAIQVAKTEEHRQQIERLNGLLDTVQSTVSVATFLNDRELASEVVSGLLQNPTVQSARIWSGDELIASGGREVPRGVAQQQPDPIIREIESPFGEKVVGRIALTPNESEIRAEINRAARYISLLLSVLLVLIGVGIVLVVVRLVTRPILQISNRLHELRAETGEKLAFPRGNETDEIGRLVGDVNALIDHLVNILHEERSLRIEREIAEKKFRTIFESSETGIFVVEEDGRLTSYNPSFERLFHLPSSDSIRSRPPRFADLFGSMAREVDDFIRQCVSEGGTCGSDFVLPDGEEETSERWVNVVLSPVEGSNLQGVVNDITQRKLSEEAAKELAVTDTLTGLSNRLAFDRRLQNLIELCEQQADHRFSLLMLDLDFFKKINDTYGHEAGDRVLKQVADRLKEKMRKTDFIARLGGDEFVVLLDGTTDRGIITEIVETILRKINEPVSIGEGKDATVGVSIGIAFYGTDTTIQSDLVRQADEAMYRAKLGGRNTYRFHEDLVEETV